MARRRFPVARGPRRQTTWVGPADQAYITVTSAAKVLVGSFAPATSVPSMQRPTIVRTRGEIHVIPAAFAADVQIVGAFGMCVVSTDAAAAGIASIPGPFDDADWDGWFVWQSFGLTYNFDTAVSGRDVAGYRMEVDSKAMRKLGPNDTVAIVAESQSSAFQINSPLRMLVKLA